MRAFAFLTVTICGLLTNLSLAAADVDCSKVTSEVAQAALISRMKFESPPPEAAEYAAAVQKQRQAVLSTLGKSTTSMTSSEFGPGFLYVAIGFERGSISGVVACSPKAGLKVISGSFSAPGHGQFGNI